MKPLRRTVINFIIFFVVYAGITYALNDEIDLQILIIISIVYFVLNYVVYTILEKVSKDH